jgi:hypothetical protein
MPLTNQEREERDYQELHSEWMLTMMDPPVECSKSCDDPDCPYTHD